MRFSITRGSVIAGSTVWGSTNTAGYFFNGWALRLNDVSILLADSVAMGLRAHSILGFESNLNRVDEESTTAIHLTRWRLARLWIVGEQCAGLILGTGKGSKYVIFLQKDDRTFLEVFLL